MAFFSPEQRRALEKWRGFYPAPQMGILEGVREVQHWFRRIPLEAEPELAEIFGVPAKTIHEVATFYPYFTQHETGKFRIGVCRNLSCTLAGGGSAAHAVENALLVPEGEATRDGVFSFELVECMGACDAAPAWMVNEELCGRLDPETLPKTLEAIRTTGKLPPAPPSSYVWAPKGEGDKRLLTKHFERDDLKTLKVYRELGGYKAFEKAKTLAPAAITEEVKKASLRGLGGAGFPVALKWSTVPPKEKLNKPHYLVVNFDESEPGCYKDRVLVERSPHQLLEAVQIAARAIDADKAIVFIRGEYERQYRILAAAIEEARKAGLLPVDVQLMRGASAYISGADSALLESIEGKKAWPRQYPPFPTVSGVMGCPTVVNNVETLCMLVPILNMGGDGFAAHGTPKSGGTVVFSVSGHVARPGIYEVPMGTPLSDVLALVGPPPSGRPVKAVIPGGTSTPVLVPSEFGVKLDFDSMRTVGSFLGAGGLIVLDESVDMVQALTIIERFLHHESCGQCTPCREGAGWTERILERIRSGGGAADDLANIERIAENIMGKVICALGDTVGMVAKSWIAKFRPEFERMLPKDGPVRPPHLRKPIQDVYHGALPPQGGRAQVFKV